jgi:hypothetical protein
MPDPKRLYPFARCNEISFFPGFDGYHMKRKKGLTLSIRIKTITGNEGENM